MNNRLGNQAEIGGVIGVGITLNGAGEDAFSREDSGEGVLISI